MSNSYFSASDHEALLTPAGRANTEIVYEKFYELHKSIFRRQRDLSWDLHPYGEKSVISSRSASVSGFIDGLAIAYSRSREQARLVERLYGRESLNAPDQIEMLHHPLIELRITPTHFAVELIVSADSWLDQQNLIGKLEVARHRQTLRGLIQQLPADTCIGFWRGPELDEMHVTAAQVGRGNLLEEWIGTFQDGHDNLRFGTWYEVESPVLDAANILSELTRRMGALYSVYNFLLWSSNNDFRKFYLQATNYSVGKDTRLS